MRRGPGEGARNLPGSLNAYEIVGEDVRGTTATVRLTGQGVQEEAALERLGSEWRIADAPGLGLSAPDSG